MSSSKANAKNKNKNKDRSEPVPQRSIGRAIYDLLASYGLATVLLALLLIITFFGTLEQVEHGLFASQKKYFESWLITQVDLGDLHIPVLLPGGFLVMVLLFINMTVGAVIRIRKNPRTIGVIIAHVAILFLLLAGFVEYFGKVDGNLALYESQTSDEYQSYHDSVIEIEKVQPAPTDGKRTALVIPARHFQDLTKGKGRTFKHESLPFDLVISNYEVNAEPRRVGSEERRWQADGYYIQPIPRDPQAEVNLDAAYVEVINKKDKSKQLGIIWRAGAPWTVQVGEEVYNIDINRRIYKMPFAVRLDKFIREVHPGTNRPRKFTSEITKLANGREEKKIITMNEPLRDNGLVLFQASFSQERMDSGGQRNRSVFAVVKNPSDNWPLYATIAVSIGLLIHMAQQLSRYLSKASRKKTESAASSN